MPRAATDSKLKAEPFADCPGRGAGYSAHPVRRAKDFIGKTIEGAHNGQSLSSGNAWPEPRKNPTASSTVNRVTHGTTGGPGMLPRTLPSPGPVITTACRPGLPGVAPQTLTVSGASRTQHHAAR